MDQFYSFAYQIFLDRLSSECNVEILLFMEFLNRSSRLAIPYIGSGEIFSHLLLFLSRNVSQRSWEVEKRNVVVFQNMKYIIEMLVTLQQNFFPFSTNG